MAEWSGTSTVLSVSVYASASFIGTSDARYTEYARFSESRACDINNDGYDDSVISASRANKTLGEIRIIYGQFRIVICLP
ncbi:MAG: hypothetical protein ACFFFG_08800 [Candidatus Thorarchaeota archaeon]